MPWGWRVAGGRSGSGSPAGRPRPELQTAGLGEPGGEHGAAGSRRRWRPRAGPWRPGRHPSGTGPCSVGVHDPAVVDPPPSQGRRVGIVEDRSRHADPGLDSVLPVVPAGEGRPRSHGRGLRPAAVHPDAVRAAAEVGAAAPRGADHPARPAAGRRSGPDGLDGHRALGIGAVRRGSIAPDHRGQPRPGRGAVPVGRGRGPGGADPDHPAGAGRSRGPAREPAPPRAAAGARRHGHRPGRRAPAASQVPRWARRRRSSGRDDRGPRGDRGGPRRSIDAARPALLRRPRRGLGPGLRRPGAPPAPGTCGGGVLDRTHPGGSLRGSDRVARCPARPREV